MLHAEINVARKIKIFSSAIDAAVLWRRVVDEHINLSTLHTPNQSVDTCPTNGSTAKVIYAFGIILLHFSGCRFLSSSRKPFEQLRWKDNYGIYSEIKSSLISRLLPPSSILYQPPNLLTHITQVYCCSSEIIPCIELVCLSFLSSLTWHYSSWEILGMRKQFFHRMRGILVMNLLINFLLPSRHLYR